MRSGRSRLPKGVSASIRNACFSADRARMADCSGYTSMSKAQAAVQCVHMSPRAVRAAGMVPGWGGQVLGWGGGGVGRSCSPLWVGDKGDMVVTSCLDALIAQIQNGVDSRHQRFQTFEMPRHADVLRSKTFQTFQTFWTGPAAIHLIPSPLYTSHKSSTTPSLTIELSSRRGSRNNR